MKKSTKKLKKFKDIVSRSNRVALDIGLYSIKCAYLKNDLLHVEEFPLFEHPKDIRNLDQHELITLQMNAIRKSAGIINADSKIILSPQPSLQALTRILHIPKDADLRGFLEKKLPFEPDQFTFDIQEYEATSSPKRTKRSPEKTSKIAVAATDLENVRRSIALLGDFQRQVEVFIPASVALLNYILLSEHSNNSQPLVLLDLGASCSHLIVFMGKDRFFTRTLDLGANHLNVELAEKLNVDFETAEKIKLEKKLIDDSLFSSEKSSASSGMFQAINSILYNLVDEIKDTMTYFEDYFDEDISTSSILLTGGASKLYNLDRFLNKELGLPIRHAADSIHEMAPNYTFSSQFASTIGLLGKPDNPGLFNINLINNIEGLLFSLPEGDYYLTRKGFIDKREYKKRHKEMARDAKRSSMHAPSQLEAPDPTIIALIKDLRDRVGAMIRGEKVDLRFSYRKVDGATLKNRMKIIFVVAGAFLLVLYGANQFYWAPKTKRVNRTINSFLEKRAELNRRIKASTFEEGGLIYTVTRTDKILWTNKLKAIAAALPGKVWISDMEIGGTTEEHEGMKTEKRSLILTCHVTSATEDHLKAIALFIKNLRKQEGFLKDFVGIKFHSADRNMEATDTVNFMLTFPLKRDLVKKVETVDRKREDGTGDIRDTLMKTDMFKHLKGARDERYRESDRR